LKLLKALGAGISITVCFFYLGCGGVQMANAAHSSNMAPLTIATRLLPSAIAGTPYVVVLDATGGTPRYAWSVTSGQLPPGMSLSPSTGIISGTPTAGGTYSVEVTVSDGSTPAETRVTTITITVAGPPISITTSTLPSAIATVSYSQQMQATGGAGSYTWSISAGKLPAGLTLASSTGTIGGTPTAGGTSTFIATVRDSEKPSQSHSAAMSLTVAPSPLTISTRTLAAEVNNQPYAQSLLASGGTPGYTWNIASGSLPQGLVLNPSTGLISGTPAGGQSATFTAQVSDKGNPAQTATASFIIAVPAPPITTSSSAFPSVIMGGSYSQTLSASGGTAPYTWSLTSGTLPSGISLSPSGAITGAASVSGSSTFTATVSDSSSPVQYASISKTIVVTPTPLTVTAPSIPNTRVGGTVSQSFAVTGGTAAYKWRVTSGTLPAGLNLSPTGVITGVVMQSGAATFTATATDSSTPVQSASATAAIVVAPTPLIITSSTLSTVGIGTSYSQTLQATGGSAPYTWSITAGSLPAGMSLAASTGTISGIPTTAGSSTISIKVTDSSSPAQVTSASTVLVVAPTLLSIPSTTLAAYTEGSAYAQSLQAVGGTAPYTWSINSGQLPAGLSLSSSGVISGVPTSTSSSSFVVTVTDSAFPSQTQSATLTMKGTAAAQIVAAATPLSVISSALSAATVGTSYTQSLQATGGTPAYTWSIPSGGLPSGLTLAATSGTISGTPTQSGTSAFTMMVTDNGSPAQTQSVPVSITVGAAQTATGPGTTWFVRTDGGTRFSSNVTTGQCDGKADAAYPGSGTNQHCAFNDVRYMWMDGTYGNSAWVMLGGDTLVIRGCSALPSQQNADAPHCRIGWDKATGNDSQNFWCAGVNASWGCSMPQPPSGTASQHTRILGGCAYGTYSCNPVIGYPYTSNNLTQLFGGFATGAVMYLTGSQYVDVEGLEITTHNGQCTLVGAIAYPSYCPNSPPYADEAQWGIITGNTTSNITLQDVYIHGFTNIGMGGPIGGPFTLTRVIIGFNAFAGWNFDDGHDTPDALGSSITANYLTVIGNGCLEEYPIVHTQFPAKSCWDSNSGGFGDGLSGQDTELDSFVCNHCGLFYNTKDAFIGPHTQITNLDVENLATAGNMGSELKFAQYLNGTATFKNDLILENCNRMSEALPGAVQNFNQATGLPGSYLTNFCRAGGESFNYITRGGSSVYFTGNTMVGADIIMIAAGCGYYTPGNMFNFEYDCLPNPNVFTNNNFLGYTDPSSIFSGEAPALYYTSPDYPYITITSTYNNEYGIKAGTGDTCGVNHITCSDPLLVHEPALTWPGSETALDVFNPFVSNNSFHPTSSSPLIGAATTLLGQTTDYYGTTRPTPPTIGAVQP
jgi:hypothetical protein